MQGNGKCISQERLVAGTAASKRHQFSLSLLPSFNLAEVSRGKRVTHREALLVAAARPRAVLQVAEKPRPSTQQCSMAAPLRHLSHV